MSKPERPNKPPPAPAQPGGFITETAPAEDVDIEALKAEHGPIRSAIIELAAPLVGRAEFLWREPTHKDLETFRKAQAETGDGAKANEVLLRAVVVAPSAARVLTVLHPGPLAIERFIIERILPFLGGSATITVTEL